MPSAATMSATPRTSPLFESTSRVLRWSAEGIGASASEAGEGKQSALSGHGREACSQPHGMGVALPVDRSGSYFGVWRVVFIRGRGLTVSIGVTTSTASIAPARRPAMSSVDRDA